MTDRRSFSEHHSLIPVDEYAVLDMPAYGAREHNLFQVAAFANEIIDCVAVGHAHYILLDDRSVVKHRGDVMTRGPDKLHSALEGLMIRACAHKSR